MKNCTELAIVVVVLIAIGLGEASKLAKRQPINCCFRKRYEYKNRSTTYPEGRVIPEDGTAYEILTENEFYRLRDAGNFHVENWHIKNGENFIGYYRYSSEDCWKYTVSDLWSEYHGDVSEDKECLSGYTKSLGSGAGPDGRIYEIYKHSYENSTLFVELGGAPGKEICEPAFVTGYFLSDSFNSVYRSTYNLLSDEEIEEILERIREVPLCGSR